MTKIDVTKEDIDRGCPQSKCHCPIAKACQRVFNLPPDCTFVSRREIHLYLNGLPFVTTVSLPPEATSFIQKFDLQGEVSPFSFEIDLNIKKEF